MFLNSIHNLRLAANNENNKLLICSMWVLRDYQLLLHFEDLG